MGQPPAVLPPDFFERQGGGAPDVLPANFFDEEQKAQPDNRSFMGKVVGMLPQMQMAEPAARVVATGMGYPLKPPSAAPKAPLGERMGTAFGTGVGGVMESLGGFAEMAGMPVVGQPMQAAGKSIQGRTRQIEDVDWTSPLDIGSFLGETIIEQTPNIALVAASALGGAGAAMRLGASAAQAAKAAEAAALTSSFLLESGNTYTSLRALGVKPETAAVSANIAGAGKMLFESVLPVKVMGQIKWLPTNKVVASESLWKAVSKGMLIEGGTEAAQEAIDIEAEILNDVGNQSTEANLMRIFNSGVKGAIVGGPFAAIGADREAPDREMPPELLSTEGPEGPAPTTRTMTEKGEALPEIPSVAMVGEELTRTVGEKLLGAGPDVFTKPMAPWKIRELLGYAKGTPLGSLAETGVIKKGTGGWFFSDEVRAVVEAKGKDLVEDFEKGLGVPTEMMETPRAQPPVAEGPFEGMEFETGNELPDTAPAFEPIESVDVLASMMDEKASKVYMDLVGEYQNPTSTPERVAWAKTQLETVHGKLGKLAPGARLTFTGDGKYQIVPRPLLGFYSAVSRAVESPKLPEKATGAQYMATLKNTPGVNAAELGWIGLDELEPNRKYTKDEIRQLVAQNGVVAKEVELPASGYASIEQVVTPWEVAEGEPLSSDEVFLHAAEELGVVDPAAQVQALRNLAENVDFPTSINTPLGSRIYNELRQAGIAPADILFDTNRTLDKMLQGSTPTLHNRWTTPGAKENYKEVYLIDENLPVTYHPPSIHVPEGTTNLIAHLRTSIRTINGKRTLLVEEIQSDLAAEMREDETTAKRTETPAYVAKAELVYNQVRALPATVNIEDTIIPAEYEKLLADPEVVAYLKAQNIDAKSYPTREVIQGIAYMLKQRTSTPTSLFARRQDWIRLTIRKAMQMAVEQGAEAVAIATGEEQIRRYPGVGEDSGLKPLYNHTIPMEVAFLVKKMGGKLDMVEWDTGAVENEMPLPANIAGVLTQRVNEAFDLHANDPTLGRAAVAEVLRDFLHYGILTQQQVYQITSTLPYATEAGGANEYREHLLAQIKQKSHEGTRKYTLPFIELTPAMRQTIAKGMPLLQLKGTEIIPARAINLQDVQRTFRGQEVLEVDGGFRVLLDNGATIFVETNGTITVVPETVARDYEAGVTGPAAGAFYEIPLGGLITLAGIADTGTLNHEAFHAAMALALNEQERARVLATYKTEERAAEAYASWAGQGEAPHSLFGKVLKFFRDLLVRLFDRGATELRSAVEQDIFSKIETGDVWKYHGDFPAWTQEEIQARKAMPKPEWLPAKDTGELSPAQKDVDKHFGQLFRNAPKEVHYQIRKDVGKWFRFGRHTMTLLQLRQVFKGYLPLEAYTSWVREFWMKKNEVLLPVHEMIQRQWLKLSKADMVSLTKLLYHVAEISHREQRRLTITEIRQEGKKLGIASADVYEVYEAADKMFRYGLQRMWKAIEANLVATSPDPMVTMLNKARLAREFRQLAERNYFPFTRFGKFGVKVKATKGFTDARGKKWRKGQQVDFRVFDSQTKQESSLKEAEADYKNAPVRISTSYLYDEENSLLGLPPMLQDMLTANLNLNEQQKLNLHELSYHLAPGHSYVKHMMQKAATPGYSRDALRAFADYFQHLSNHIARLETRAGMDGALSQVRKDAKSVQPGRSYGLLYETLTNHMAYLFNPGNEMSVLRGGVFLWFFALSPAQAIVNLTQVPVFAYSYLAKRYGDSRTVMAIVRATKNSFAYMAKGDKALTAEQLAALEWGKKEGALSEYLAAEVAAVANGSVFSGKGNPVLENKVRQIFQVTTAHFKWSETLNRYTTFLAAYDIARLEGETVERAQVAARTAVDETMFEYARWNRMPIARGRAAVFFIFKTYMQELINFAITNKGGWRFWLMLVALGGMRGIPGSDDIMELLNLLGTKMKEALGLKNPKVDLEREARQFAKEVGLNPDLLMDGIARYGLGLQGLEMLFGTPTPALDFSTKVQMGRLIPGLSTTAKALQGEMDYKTWATQFIQEGLGAFGNISMGMTKAVMEPGAEGFSPSGIAKAAGPSVVKGVMRALDILHSGGYKDRNGNILVPFDPENPAHLGEIIGQAAGVTSSRVSRAREAYAMSKGRESYILNRREGLLAAYGVARDEDERAEAREAVKTFNASVEPRERISSAQIIASRRARQRNRMLRERGYPTANRYRQLFKEDRQLFLSGLEREAAEIPERK